ncbi:hypothetical protein V6N13_136966 [Hibiscus sabdariffa]
MGSWWKRIKQLTHEDEVYEIPSGDDDCSKGMKKWLTDYHQSRPGLKVLQQSIDEFIIAHEAKLEQATPIHELSQAQAQHVPDQPMGRLIPDSTAFPAYLALHASPTERKEKEARLTEGGWVLVEHHKGRKKTTDSESGTAVGSVSQAAVEDKLAKTKSKEVSDFYRFQKREADRNELLTLQSKFEQDKKRIQQMRAARTLLSATDA